MSKQINDERPFKIIVIGEVFTGKTSLINLYCNKQFKAHYETTIGSSLHVKQIKSCGKEIKLQFWDTSGQERYQSLTKAFYKGASCCLVLYDITSSKTFSKVEFWAKAFQENISSNDSNALFVIVGNKIDLEDKREVKKEEGVVLAQKVGALFFETSAKEKPESVNLVFETVAKKLIEIRDHTNLNPEYTDEINLAHHKPNTKHQPNRCC